MFTLCVAVSVLAMVAASIPDVILTPKNSDNSQAAALILAPGFGIGADAYLPIGNALQESFASVGIDLYFGVPHMAGNITTVGLKGALNKVGKQLVEAGLPEDHKTFFAGHSVGGALLPYIIEKPENLMEGFNSPDGMILMASFLVRSFRGKSEPDVGPGQYSFPVCPVLSIGAELDGLARLPRFAEALHNQITQNTDPEAAKRTLPVTMIEGMTHMQFASGPIPSNVHNRDLIPEITYDEAHDFVAKDAAAFANGLINNNWDVLMNRQTESATLLAPMIEAFEMEGYHQFKPPCYCEALDEYGGLEYGTCPEQPGCTSGAPWTQVGQQIMAGNKDWQSGKGIIMYSTDSQHIVTEENPSCHLPHLHAGLDRDSNEEITNAIAAANPGSKGAPALCSGPEACTLKSNTVTQLWYETGSEFDIWRISTGNSNADTGFYPISAAEMKSKMKSRQAIQQAANVTDAVSEKSSFEDLDGNANGNCAEINAAALQWASDKAIERTRARYEKYGQKMVSSTEGDKKVCAAGPCWIWSSLEYEGRGKDGDVTLVPPAFPFKNNNPFPCDEKKYPVDDRKVVLPCTAGMHYCKLVSPARVMEWMMVDSLRLNYSLKSQAKEMEVIQEHTKCCNTCPTSTDKYYSTPMLQKHNCGESCIAPSDYDKFKLFEPGLTLAETAHPCQDKGFLTYDHTETHGAGPIKVTVDFYVNNA